DRDETLQRPTLTPSPAAGVNDDLPSRLLAPRIRQLDRRRRSATIDASAERRALPFQIALPLPSNVRPMLRPVARVETEQPRRPQHGQALVDWRMRVAQRAENSPPLNRRRQRSRRRTAMV